MVTSNLTSWSACGPAIASLQEMIEALKKTRKDNKNPPSPPNAGNSGPPPDQRLIDMLAELKMIRSMQLRTSPVDQNAADRGHAIRTVLACLLNYGSVTFTVLTETSKNRGKR